MGYIVRRGDSGRGNKGVEKIEEEEVNREEAKDLLETLIGMVDDNHHSDYDSALKVGIECMDRVHELENENKDLFYKLAGVMYFVDKWIDDGEAEGLNEVQRADFVREKLLKEFETLSQPEIVRCAECKNYHRINPYQDDGVCYVDGSGCCGSDNCMEHFGAERRTDED